MAFTVNLTWTNKSVNISKQAIHFGDETTPILVDGNVSAAATTYTHLLPEEYTSGKVYYRVSSIVTTAEGDVVETSELLTIDLDVNQGFIYHTTSTVYNIVSLSAFQAIFADGTIITPSAMEIPGAGVSAYLLNTNQVAGRTRILPLNGNTFDILSISSLVTSIESWGDYTYVAHPEVTSSPKAITIAPEGLVGVPNVAPNIADFTSLFEGALLLNDPNLISWDMSNATICERMFYGCNALNQPLGVWNTSHIENMEGMFGYTYAFDQDLSQWCVPHTPDSVIYGSMFESSAIVDEHKPVAFSCPRNEINFVTIVDQNTYRGLVGIGGTETYSLDFYTNINGDPVWTSSNEAIMTVDNGTVTGVSPGTATITLTIEGVTSTITLEARPVFQSMQVTKPAGAGSVQLQFILNRPQPLHLVVKDTYGAIQVIDLNPFESINITFYTNGTDESIVEIYCPFEKLPNVIFNNITVVNQWPGGGWDGMSLGAAIVTVPTSIPTSVTSFAGLFANTANFNQDISGWNTVNITNFDQMFMYATNFNQDISGWNTSNVESMQQSFYGATTFNQPIGSWNVSKCTNMQQAIGYTTAFDQDLSQWCVPAVYNYNFAVGSGIQPEHLPVWGTCPRGENL